MVNSNLITVYIGLGSNLAEPIEQIKTARHAISTLPTVEIIALSNFYSSPALGGMEQPNYVNAVLSILTILSPLVLLQHLQAIENAQGRVREQRWGARTLDLDILLYGDQTIDLPDLTIPHYGLAERAFVLYPLAEIAPTLSIPHHGSLNNLLSKCPLNDLVKLELS